MTPQPLITSPSHLPDIVADENLPHQNEKKKINYVLLSMQHTKWHSQHSKNRPSNVPFIH